MWKNIGVNYFFYMNLGERDEIKWEDKIWLLLNSFFGC